MNRNQHQGYFGEAFVQVLAAAAGLIATRPTLDITGTDFLIGYQGARKGVRHPVVEIQVKSWSRSSAKFSNGCWNYSMKTPHFNNLAGTFSLDRYLALVVVPEDQPRYAVPKPELLELRHCAYWLSLADREPVSPETQKSITVKVPLRNVLTPETLLDLVTGTAPEKDRS